MIEPKNSIKRRTRIASRLARSAFDQSSPEQVNARFRAAISLGLQLDEPLDVGDKARRACPKSPLAVLAATMGNWHLEGEPFWGPKQQAQADPEWVFKALNELGVDWTGAGRLCPRSEPRTLMDHAAGAGNWQCARLVAQGGASWLKSEASSWDSPIAWLAFTRSDQSGIDRRAWAKARAELNAAMASGSAKAGKWLPMLGTVEISRINAPRTSVFNWTRWFEQASAYGVASWRATLPLPEGYRPDALNQLGLDWVSRPSFALAMTRQAFSRPEALAAGLLTPSFEPDPRSFWALGASLAEVCESMKTPGDQLRASRKVERTLALLTPWHDILMLANQEPKALKGHAYEHRSAKRLGTKILSGWVRALADFVAPTKEGGHEKKIPESVCKVILALVEWLPGQQDDALWAINSEHFARTLWRHPAAGDLLSEPHSARAKRTLDGLKALAHAGPAGQSLVCAALANMANELQNGFGRDYGWSQTMGQGVAAVMGSAMSMDLGGEPSKQGLWELWSKTCEGAARHDWGESRAEMLKWAQICAARLEADQIGATAHAAPVPKSGNKLRM